MTGKSPNLFSAKTEYVQTCFRREYEDAAIKKCGVLGDPRKISAKMVTNKGGTLWLRAAKMRQQVVVDLSWKLKFYSPRGRSG